MNQLEELLYRAARRIFSRIQERHNLSSREFEDKGIPKFDIEWVNIQNLKPLLNRDELLKHLPKGAVVAEIGVAEGVFSQKIFDICAPTHLHLVDSWASGRYPMAFKKKVENQFEEQISKGQVSIHINDSVKAASFFPDSYFDWIYLDSDHSYERTKRELETYRYKIKEGGLIAGHDFIQGNWVGGVRYGVIEAVYEFCIKYGWELYYLTMDFNEHPSFVIRQISEAV